MPRLPLIQPDTADSETAGLLAGVQQALGRTPNMTKAMANSPAVLKGYLGFSGALAAGVLPVHLRERLSLLVAQENGCDYCLSAHTYLGEKRGRLDADQIAAARRGEAEAPKSAAALAFAKAVLRSRGGVDDADLKAAREAGLTDEEIAEVVATVALQVFTNYFNKTADTDIDWPVVRHDH
ncbi:carboxymuconolactone decarboxylase family protein [Glycomyces tritici]|uniref:Carboxymuconolactone decarboxylase family protein n=1 Tax=Glycomyces tritici TaxID=2665176 RepID=A0ABT7YRZ1_9ACTN|nr:carboxymuconolactone decarboxylase family protein [Glycomyces tritici]MDN3241023.1 carboxymuconolactone decarboxylase family protein [Glycomyces tritici]